MPVLGLATLALSLVYVANVVVGKLSLALTDRFTPIGIGDKASALLLFVISILFTVIILRREHEVLGGGSRS